ncbi:PEGA domain-containing protein [Candidatus Woesearchaeota archaeon]|nr:PEGA domain-containing protein [Candidatus Woesearchaeota archaeon]
MKLNYALVFALFLIIIAGCQVKKELQTEEEKEISSGSGLLSVETIPSEADVFLGNGYAGKSPVEISNIAVGSYSITIKKEGYMDFTADIVIEAGKKSIITAELKLMPKVAPETKKEIPKEIEAAIAEQKKESKDKEITDKEIASNKIAAGSYILLYYDFSKKKFATERSLEDDIFSSRMPTHFAFTRFAPATIKTIDKGIEIVTKEDCSSADNTFQTLSSGQTLCVLTKEKNVVALGSYWDNPKDANLTWKMFG